MRMFFQAKVWKQTSTRRMNPITSTWEIHRAKDNVLFSMHLSSWSEKMEILKKILFQLCTCQVLVWEDRCNKQQAKEYFSYCAPVKLVWQMQTQRATDPKVTFANCTELDLRPWMPEKKWRGGVISYIFGHAKMYYDVDLPQIWVSWPHLCFWEENFEGMAFLWPLDDRQQEEERDGIVEPRRAGVKKSKSGHHKLKNKIPKIIIPMHEGVWLSS